MADKDLVQLMSELARLLSPRSASGNSGRHAARWQLYLFADLRGYSNEWCDEVLAIFSDTTPQQQLAA